MKFEPQPDPNLKTPRLALPRGAVDTHIHLFGPAAKFPFAADSTYAAPDALPETNIALQDRLGLSYAVIVSGGAYGRDYSVLADALARFPDRFRGIALMPEYTPDAEFARLTSLGVRGLRFISAARGLRLPTISKEVAACAFAHGWHVQFYPFGDLVQYADVVLALPNTIVLDHFAGVAAAGGVEQDAFRTLLRMLDTGRVWLKLSAPMRFSSRNFPYADMTPLARALVAHAPERMLWGTDWPHVNMDGRPMVNDGDLVDLLAEWVPDAATRKRILVENPAALYGFPKLD